MGREPNVKSVIPVGERVSLKEKVAFSLGDGFNAFGVGLIFGGLWMPFFNLGVGLNAAVLGGIAMLYRVWDAFTDPVIGYLSDHANTRFGRRKPFMVVGAVGVACLLPLPWFLVPGLSENSAYALLIAAGLVLYLLSTCWAMPYYGLQIELTPNYDERTRVSAWMGAATKLFGLTAPAVLAIVSSDLFADPVTGKADIVRGTQAIAPALMLMVLVFGLLPPLFVAERPRSEATRKREQEETFLQGLRYSFTCGPLWHLIVISFCKVLGGSLAAGLAFYVNIFRVNAGNIGDASVIEFWGGVVKLVAGLALIPLWMKLAELWDKKIVAAILLASGVVGQFISLVCYRPDMPYLQLIPAGFGSGVIAAVWLILPSMKADLADYEELRTGLRREGGLNSFYSWFIKLALTGAAGLIGLVIHYVAGIDPKLDAQPPEVIDRLFASFIWAPAVVLAIPMYSLWRYPLNRERMAEIRAELERRRGTLPAA